MNFHIAAQPGEIAESVIISGDPLRIRHMAGMLLDNAFCFNEIRGMYGYTGTYKGKRVSMLGTGIGIPSTALYIHELAMHHKVKNIIRAGTMGAMLPDLAIGDLVLAMSASSDSNTNNILFNGLSYAPSASYELLEGAVKACREKGLGCRVGQVFSTDRFYSNEANRWEKWIEHGILGVEMETSAIYTLAARYKIQALSILSVSDNLITGEASDPETREKQFTKMFEIALTLTP